MPFIVRAGPQYPLHLAVADTDAGIDVCLLSPTSDRLGDASINAGTGNIHRFTLQGTTIDKRLGGARPPCQGTHPAPLREKST